MIVNLILILISFCIFSAYNLFICTKYKIPTSLSASYYELPIKWRWVFTVFMWIIAIVLLISWINIAKSFPDWRQHLSVLAFLTCGLICFVGTAPNFRAFEMENKVHTISATTAAVTALIWCFSCVYMYVAFITGFVLFGVLLIGLLSKTLKSCKVYWLEMIAFMITYGSLLIITLQSIL